MHCAKDLSDTMDNLSLDQLTGELHLEHDVSTVDYSNVHQYSSQIGKTLKKANRDFKTRMQQQHTDYDTVTEEYPTVHWSNLPSSMWLKSPVPETVETYEFDSESEEKNSSDVTVICEQRVRENPPEDLNVSRHFIWFSSILFLICIHVWRHQHD
jgi:hypothetical protein